MRLQTGVLAAVLPAVALAASGTGFVGRRWDCCKPSCSWPDKAEGQLSEGPVGFCDINDSPISNYTEQSGCVDGGTGFTCSSHQPFAVNDTLSYGFSRVIIAGGNESSWCCACYQLKFTSAPLEGKVMVVQATNTDSTLEENQFRLAVPGSAGFTGGCVTQFGESSIWASDGGVTTQDQCSQMPDSLQSGCNWRFDWYMNADNSTFDYEQVQCPNELVQISGCMRDDDSSFPAAQVSEASSEGGSSDNSDSDSSASSTTLSFIQRVLGAISLVVALS